MLKRLLPLGLIAAGVLLLVASGLYYWYSEALANPGAAPLPPSVAGQALRQQSQGVEAVAEISQLHGKQFPLVSGAMGVYGGGQVMLWVSGAPAAPLAGEMVRVMRDKIAEGRSPFTPVGPRPEAGRDVYELTGMGQRHFYFQAGALVVWLAADDGLAEAALQEVLAFYAP